MGLYTDAEKAMPPLSHLECMECGKKQPVGGVAQKLANGWPECCGLTMRLFTVRETEESVNP